MLKLLSRLSKGLKASNRPERIDAERIYRAIMKQSRNPVFYKPEYIEDTTDGRMEWLTAHLSVVMHVLQKYGNDGATLSQAIYDTMVDDFDIALREEGLSDSGVKRRIKPLAKMFLSRGRVYAATLEGGGEPLEVLVQRYILQDREVDKELNPLTSYLEKFSSNCQNMSLDDLGKALFDYPQF